jgi:hypothetical protein
MAGTFVCGKFLTLIRDSRSSGNPFAVGITPVLPMARLGNVILKSQIISNFNVRVGQFPALAGMLKLISPGAGYLCTYADS